MIFVTVGTHNQQFNRLLIEIDRLVERKKIKDVIAQIGHSSYIPKNYRWVKFLDFEKMLKIQKKSDLIITHAGIGSIMTALDLNKPTVVVPRLPEYNEHVDEHQLITVRELEKLGRIIAVYEIRNLAKAIEKTANFKPKQKSTKSEILKIVESYLSSLES